MYEERQVVDTAVDKRPFIHILGAGLLLLDLNLYVQRRRFATPNEISTASYPPAVHNIVDDR